MKTQTYNFVAKSKSFLASFLLLLTFIQLKAEGSLQANTSDSLTFAQAFINLSLTETYFDTLSVSRISKILPFVENELNSIKDPNFIKSNDCIYNFTYALLYFNKTKLLFRTKTQTNREVLLQWKNSLGLAIRYFNLSGLDKYFSPFMPYAYVNEKENSFFDFIGFTPKSGHDLKAEILKLKAQLNPYFNKDIYPDFQRIFYTSKKSGHFYFDSLFRYTAMYNLPIDRSIIDYWEDGKTTNIPRRKTDWTISENYMLDMALDLISRYLQLKHIAEKDSVPKKSLCAVIVFTSYHNFIEDLNLKDPTSFNDPVSNGQIPKDRFFREEMDSSACNSLYSKLDEKYSSNKDCYTEMNNPKHMKIPRTGNAGYKYYFPVPAPFPSAYLYINNFQPGLTRLKQVDNYLANIFNGAKYAGHLHYYYVQSGFAITTSLEKINANGSPVSDSRRWSVSTGGNGKFTFYEVFRSIFFSTESDFRIIALIVSPGAATVRSSGVSLNAMQDLINNSYPSLPRDLEDFSLPAKTLTVLVYNFHQNDIGQVPMLDTTKRLTVRNHLERSGLGGLLQNR